jgi:hypothetical protein
MQYKHLAISSLATIWDYFACFRPGNVPALFPDFFAFYSLLAEVHG